MRTAKLSQDEILRLLSPGARSLAADSLADAGAVLGDDLVQYGGLASRFGDVAYDRPVSRPPASAPSLGLRTRAGMASGPDSGADRARQLRPLSPQDRDPDPNPENPQPYATIIGGREATITPTGHKSIASYVHGLPNSEDAANILGGWARSAGSEQIIREAAANIRSDLGFSAPKFSAFDPRDQITTTYQNIVVADMLSTISANLRDRARSFASAKEAAPLLRLSSDMENYAASISGGVSRGAIAMPNNYQYGKDWIDFDTMLRAQLDDYYFPKGPVAREYTPEMAAQDADLARGRAWFRTDPGGFDFASIAHNNGWSIDRIEAGEALSGIVADLASAGRISGERPRSTVVRNGFGEARGIPLAEFEVGATRVDEKSSVGLNKRRGDIYEEEQINTILPRSYIFIEPQITIQSNGPSGSKVRVDALAFDYTDGTINLFDMKASKKAPFTKKQKIGYPEIAKYGGTIKGAGKGRYKGGLIIPPTRININRNHKR